MADKVEPNKATTLKHETVRGIFLEQSLVFALKHDSRVFIVKLVDERQQEVLILVPCIKRYRWIPAFLTEQMAGKSELLVTNLKQVKLFRGTSHEITVFQVSQRSEARRLKLKDDGLGLQITNTASPEANKLLSYKGVITREVDAQCGVYMVDKRILLFASPIIHAVDINIRLGDTVSLYNVHLVTYQEKKTFVMCGRSYISVDDPEQENFKTEANNSTDKIHPLISLLAGTSFSLEQFFAVYHYYQKLSAALQGLFSVRKLLARCVDNERSSSESDRLASSSCKRSLLKEYVHHDQCCSLTPSLPDSDQARNHNNDINVFVDHVVILQEIEKMFDDLTPSQDEFLCHAYTLNDTQTTRLYGLLKNEAGQYFLEDNNSRLEVKLTEEHRRVARPGCIVEISEPTLSAENLDGETFNYLIVNTMKVVTNLDHKDEIVKKLKDDDEDVFKILSKSEVLPGAKSDYFLVALLSQEQNRVILKLTCLDRYSEISEGASLGLGIKHELLLRTSSMTSQVMLSLDEDWDCNQVYGLRNEADIEIFRMPIHDVNLKLLETSLGNLGLSKESELLNISGIITERRIERSAQGSKADSTLVLQVSSEEAFAVQVYIKTRLVRLQRGLIPGTSWRFSDMKKMISKKGNIYLLSTVMSTFSLTGIKNQAEVSFSSNENGAATPSLGSVSCLLAGRMLGAQIVFSIVSVATINVRVECGACGSLVEKGVCSYVGCNAPPSNIISGSGCFEIEDDSGAAVLTTTSLAHLKCLLNLSELDVERLDSRLLSQGELKFSRWSLKTSDDCLRKLVETSLSVFYLCQARVRRYVCGGGETKLFCISIRKPNTLDINATLEAAIDALQKKNQF